jgi:hypothetical protein
MTKPFQQVDQLPARPETFVAMELGGGAAKTTTGGAPGSFAERSWINFPSAVRSPTCQCGGRRPCVPCSSPRVSERGASLFQIGPEAHALIARKACPGELFVAASSA